MSVSGIQGQLLEVTVVACTKLKDTEWISRQDPYVILEYGSSKFRTRTCTDGGKNPTFQEKFVFTLIEGLRELNVVVWNSNTLTYDDFIGSGKVQLQKVLSQGFDDSSWTLQTKKGRYAGEIRLILHFASTNKPTSTHHSSSAPPYSAPPPLYPALPPPISISGYPSPVTAYSAPHSHPPSYPPSTVAYPPPVSAAYPPASAAYPPPGSSAYPHISAAYPPSSYPPPEPTAYPPQPYPPSSVYPPPMYPPPPHGSSHYPPGPYPGAYPPPPPHY